MQRRKNYKKRAMVNFSIGVAIATGLFGLARRDAKIRSADIDALKQRSVAEKQARKSQAARVRELAKWSQEMNEKSRAEFLAAMEVSPKTPNLLMKVNPEKLAPWLRESQISLREKYLRSPLLKSELERNKRVYGNWVKVYCKEFNFPEDVAKKVLQKESKWHPLAVSNAGAFGLMQMHWSLIGSEYTTRYRHNPFDPQKSIRLGIMRLSDLYKHFNGDMEKTLTAYNIRGGQERIDKAVKEMGNGWRDYQFSIKTNSYYKAVLKEKL